MRRFRPGRGLLHRISREQGRFWFEDEDSNLINNRQNGRRRGRGGQRPQGGGSQGSRDNGNRIDSRARGNASQLYEKYKNMASDAQRQGDRVNTEYYLQFADHYFRVLADQRGRYDDNNRERRPQNDFDGDEDYGDEGDAIRADEQGRGNQDDRGGERGSRQRDDQRPRAHRDDEQRADGEQGNAQRSDNRRQDDHRRPEGDRQRERRPRYAGAREGQPREEYAAEQPQSTGDGEGYADARVTASDSDNAMGQPPVRDEASAEASAPKRRGRPRKVVAEDGDQLGFDASALPPAIGGEEAAGDAAPKPRRRRSIATPAEVEA